MNAKELKQKASNWKDSKELTVLQRALDEALYSDFGITTNCKIEDFSFPPTFSKDNNPIKFNCCSIDNIITQNPILNLFTSFELFVDGYIVIDEQNQFSIVDGELQAWVEHLEGDDIFTFGKATYTEEYGWEFEDTVIH